MSFLLLDHPMTAHEHKTWNILFERQSRLLKDRAADEVIEGLEKLKICSSEIPKFSEINAILQNQTGFSIVPVKGFVPEDLFFQFLAERKFPVTCFIRSTNQLDYIEEPDIFHDIFGHVPLLVNPVFADFMQQFGIKGVEAIKAGMLKFAATLYWFTVEFGLIKTSQGLRIYGAGIISSKDESIYCLESDIPVRVKFDLRRVMKTLYHIDSLQRTYFVIEDFQQLFDALHNLRWDDVRDTCLFFPEIDQGIIINNKESVKLGD